MNALAKYDQARNALAACRSVDEIKDIRDKSEAMRLYAKQAQDTELEQWAAEIKLRAQRAIGEISAALEKQKNQAALPTGGKSKSETLADAGISTSTANRYEKLAAIPEPMIEEVIAKSKEAGKPVSAKAVMATLAPRAPVAKPAPANATPAPAPGARPSLVEQVKAQQDVENAPDAAGAGAVDEVDIADAPDSDDESHAQLLDDYHAAARARDELQSKVTELEAHIALLTRADLNAEVANTLVKRAADAEFKFEQLSGRNRQLQQTARDAQLTNQSLTDQLAKIRLALGVESNRDILPAIAARRAA